MCGALERKIVYLHFNQHFGVNFVTWGNRENEWWPSDRATRVSLSTQHRLDLKLTSVWLLCCTREQQSKRTVSPARPSTHSVTELGARRIQTCLPLQACFFTLHSQIYNQFNVTTTILYFFKINKNN